MAELQAWLPIPESSDFSIYNLPFGIFSTNRFGPRVGVAIGDQVLDLVGLAQKGLIEVPIPVLSQPFLNDFIRLGKQRTRAVRQSIQHLLSDVDSPLKDFPTLLLPQKKVTMHLPIRVGDYTDFYSSKEHATNVGAMFRDPEKALLPNWKHLPVGYHGRASSIIVSGQPIHRPYGQTMPRAAESPVFGPSRRLDFELEMAFIISQDSQLGQQISTSEAEDYIFGMVLFNDWSARDIQKWEYVPLGPFLGKSFASSVSPWVVTLDALAVFRVSGPQQDPPVLPYLQFAGKQNYDIQLEVNLQPKDAQATTICHSNTKYLYWNIVQQLAHHTVNGCNVRVGDLMASGTISGPEPGQYGSMLELSWGGQKKVGLRDGQERTFIEDYDTVTMRAFAERPGKRVGFGEVSNQLLPAISINH
jgi:fumarylacetoacetase